MPTTMGRMNMQRTPPMMTTMGQRGMENAPGGGGGFSPVRPATDIHAGAISNRTYHRNTRGIRGGLVSGIGREDMST